MHDHNFSYKKLLIDLIDECCGDNQIVIDNLEIFAQTIDEFNAAFEARTIVEYLDYLRAMVVLFSSISQKLPPQNKQNEDLEEEETDNHFAALTLMYDRLCERTQGTQAAIEDTHGSYVPKLELKF